MEHKIGSTEVCLYNFGYARWVMTRDIVIGLAPVRVAASFSCVINQNIEGRERFHVTIDGVFAVNTKFGTGKISGHGIDPRTIRPLTVWLASDASEDFNGCRFVADRWDSTLSVREAALGCQEPQIFPRPERDTPLKRAWMDDLS